MVNSQLNELLSNLNGTDFELVLPSKYHAGTEPYLYSKSGDIIIEWDYDCNNSYQISWGGSVIKVVSSINDVLKVLTLISNK
jgi:hypothetical protein